MPVTDGSRCLAGAGLQSPDLRLDVVAAMVILGALGTGIAYAINYRLINDEGGTVASTVTYLLPVVATTLGVAVLGEPISILVVLGMAVVLVGVALVRRGEPAQWATTTSGNER